MGLYADPATKRQRLDAWRAALVTERATYDPDYRDLADHFAPRRARFLPSDRQGGRRDQKINDNTGRIAMRTLGSGLHSGLTSPARPWFKLTTPDPSLAEQPAVKTWLHLVTTRMLNLFATTNLYNVLPIVYFDMGCFATAAMSILRDRKDLFRAYVYPIGSYVLAVDDRGIVSTFAREYELSVRQLVQQFVVAEDGRSMNWSVCSETVKQAWERGNYETKIDVCWMVTPNEDYSQESALAKHKKFASCYFEIGAAKNAGDNQKFLRESGFNSFPLMCPRWDVTSSEDAYGQDSPGMMALGDTRQLQVMERRKGQLLAKAVDPPLQGPSSLRNQKVSLYGGDITYVDSREGQNTLKPIHEIRLEGVQYITEDEDRVRYRIQRACYEDLFLMLAASDERLGADRPTAREVEERHEEKLLALGPTLERAEDELHNPIIDRVFEMGIEDGLFPDPPEALQGVKLKVEYTSILAQAQKLVSVVGQQRFVGDIVAVAEIVPDVLDKVDWDQAIDISGDSLGVDPRIIVPTDVARERRAQRQQQQQAAAQSEQAMNLARAAKDASQAPLSGDTVLNRLAQAGAQQAPDAAAVGA
jgi:hypothetical protein